ncbi:MAG: hypothetical protein IPK26_03690 [Planctomycetes bacterium]|nr:hypothetical protein [Planctomycetota bacterium]
MEPTRTPATNLVSSRPLPYPQRCDLAFDEIVNAGALPDVPAADWVDPASDAHWQGLAKTFGGMLFPAHQPARLFVACVDTGTVDVFEIATGQRLVTLSVPGVAVLANYWRQ